MKRFLTAALVAMFAVTGSAFAQDDSMKDGKSMDTKQMNMPMSGMMSASDMEKAQWAFFNADKREVERFKAKGFSELEFRGIANIAYESGTSTDYVGRLVKEVGRPFNFVAAQLGVPTGYIYREIPGFGAANMGEMMGNMKTNKPMMEDKTAMTAGTVVDVAITDPNLTTFVAAVKAAGLVDTLNGSGPFTILAPSNAAFAKLPAGALEDLLKPENKEKLVSILTYHVIPGKVMAKDVMSMANPSMPTTVNGKQLTVKTTDPVMFNNAGLEKADVAASNGVIHVIDSVLMPEM